MSKEQAIFHAMVLEAHSNHQRHVMRDEASAREALHDAAWIRFEVARCVARCNGEIDEERRALIENKMTEWGFRV